MESNDWGGNDPKNPKNAQKKSDAGIDSTFLFSLMSSESIMGSNNSVTEFKGIRESLVEKLNGLRGQGVPDVLKLSIPSIADTTSSQCPDLPGVILYVIYNSRALLMPVLFYKKDAVKVIETSFGSSGEVTGSRSVYADSFINKEVSEKIKSDFSTYDGKQMNRVDIISTYIVDVAQYTGLKLDEKVTFDNIASAVMREWYNAMFNDTLLTFATTNEKSLPAVVEGDNLFGVDSAAMITIDIVPPPVVLEGRPVPYNLKVTAAAVPKSMSYNRTTVNTKAVGTTYLNVSLEVMSKDKYFQVMSMPQFNRGGTRGPLVPVISLGRTLPGGQFRNNDSMLSTVLGIFNMLSANNPIFFTEALRVRDAGVRGSLANLATVAYRNSGRVPPNELILTKKSLIDRNTTLEFCRNYISPQAVFVIDLPCFTENPSNTNFWWKLFDSKDPKHGQFLRAFYLIIDKLSSGAFFNYLAEQDKEENRNNGLWKRYDPIATQSPAIIPAGTATMNGQFFNIEEIDQMFLRNATAYGENEDAISKYVSRVSGTVPGLSIPARQMEIKNMLEGLFAGSVDITAWKSRWVFNDKFLQMIVRVMKSTFAINVTSSTETYSGWEAQESNDYLNQASSASVASNGYGNNLGYNGYTYR